MGIVRRYKLQAFNVRELFPGIDAIPDFIVQLTDGRVFVIEVKARRFLSPDVLSMITTIREALAGHGLPYLLWTDRDPEGKTNKLNRAVWANTREFQRGMTLEFEPGAEELVKTFVEKGGSNVGDLMGPDGCGWDMAIAAFARGVFYINLQEEINERSTLNKNFSPSQWSHFFESGNTPQTWWDSLPSHTVY